MGISITNTIYLGKATPASAGGSHNLGWYATPEALQAAHPTGDNGDWAMVGSTDTVWTWDSDTSAWVDTGTTNAADRNLSNLTDTGKANIAALGTYNPGTAYVSGTIGQALYGKANTNLGNLAVSGKNIANWSSNVSNCITEIPQDIKVELSNGTVTLKAGSKVYMPNGAGNFDVITTTTDRTWTYNSDGKRFLCLTSTGYINNTADATNWVVSGATDPLAGSAWHDWYDTTNNVINHYTGDASTPSTTLSFPFALVTVSGGQVSSIDQVFNGFGYIGSSVFALPGLSGATAGGRNANGTLMAQKRTISNVSVVTSTAIATDVYVAIKNTGEISWSNPASRLIYKEPENLWYDTQLQAYQNAVFFTRVKFASSRISEFYPATTFHAVDYNDTEYIAHQAMPSSRYTNLTLPASAGTVTAPADGYLTVNKSATAAGQYINFINGSNGMNCNSIATSALPLRLYMPVSKGDVITINYDADGTTTMFRFVYANGAK